MVLEERRQEEQDSYPTEYIHRDVEVLNRAVRAEKGGETAMLEIIVRRSDAHLREVLRSYEKFHRDNFAREALRKSGNLVVSHLPLPFKPRGRRKKSKNHLKIEKKKRERKKGTKNRKISDTETDASKNRAKS
jgi:hypothetical protein